MVLIYQVLTRQCLKKVFLTSNDFVPNDSSLLKYYDLAKVHVFNFKTNTTHMSILTDLIDHDLFLKTSNGSKRKPLSINTSG